MAATTTTTNNTYEDFFAQAGKISSENEDLKQQLRETRKHATQLEQEVNALTKRGQQQAADIEASRTLEAQVKDLREENNRLAAEVRRLETQAAKNEPLVEAVKTFAQAVRGV
jgi:predicted nuclease with TOPRIM domain